MVAHAPGNADQLAIPSLEAEYEDLPFEWRDYGKKLVANLIQATVNYNKANRKEPKSFHQIANMVGQTITHVTIRNYAKGYVSNPSKDDYKTIKAIAPLIYRFIRVDGRKVIFNPNKTYSGPNGWKELVKLGDMDGSWDPDQEVAFDMGGAKIYNSGNYINDPQAMASAMKPVGEAIAGAIVGTFMGLMQKNYTEGLNSPLQYPKVIEGDSRMSNSSSPASDRIRALLLTFCRENGCSSNSEEGDFNISSLADLMGSNISAERLAGLINGLFDPSGLTIEEYGVLASRLKNPDTNQPFASSVLLAEYVMQRKVFILGSKPEEEDDQDGCENGNGNRLNGVH